MPRPETGVIIIRGVRLEKVPLDRVIKPKENELIQKRIVDLKFGFNKLDEILTDPYWRGDPISLTKKDHMFSIMDGRHRVHLATKDGRKYVWARIVD